ncbi:hypothetical protein Bca4012_080858 [Brassica carinata]|uniref:(rape) hypothetical protein n=1 Tax=Brassica napus TaxID=3708 RepID=A0A816N7K5_BRANA|nr:unnamed protein product [Brassica napus]
MVSSWQVGVKKESLVLIGFMGDTSLQKTKIQGQKEIVNRFSHSLVFIRRVCKNSFRGIDAKELQSQGMNQELLQVEACMVQGPVANDSRELVSKVKIDNIDIMTSKTTQLDFFGGLKTQAINDGSIRGPMHMFMQSASVLQWHLY